MNIEKGTNKYICKQARNHICVDRWTKPCINEQRHKSTHLPTETLTQTYVYKYKHKRAPIQARTYE